MPKLTEYMDDQFDDKAIEPSKGSTPDPIPSGKYVLQVEQGDMVHTKSGTGVMFKARIAVVVGEYEGRTVYAQMNVRNQNVTAQTIGISEMKALAAATGVNWDVAREETDTMLFKPFEAEVGMERENINEETGKPYPPRNRIVKYIPKGQAKGLGAAVGKAAVSGTKQAPKRVIDADDEVPF